ncbi:hypothetical protein os1_17210 [Comamonadaceae bacterium OS-1]|nr:hypothetical protein os1_17210 [Comamonadaceae bacterium OS-1]
MNAELLKLLSTIHSHIKQTSTPYYTENPALGASVKRLHDFKMIEADCVISKGRNDPGVVLYAKASRLTPAGLAALA